MGAKWRNPLARQILEKGGVSKSSWLSGEIKQPTGHLLPIKFHQDYLRAIFNGAENVKVKVHYNQIYFLLFLTFHIPAC